MQRASRAITRAALVWSLAAWVVAAEVPPLEQFLPERLAYWQKRLGLEEWKVSPVLTKRSEMPQGTMGGIRWDKKKKSAVMTILHPEDYHLQGRPMLEDMEFTIVHELIHLELASLPRSNASRGHEERAVDNLTRALLGLQPERVQRHEE